MTLNRALTKQNQAVNGKEVVLTEPTDKELVSAARAGDERAFEKIVLRYQARLIRFVEFGIKDHEKAEDLVQETFLRVYLHLRNFDPENNFRAWIYTIASNLMKDELKSSSRKCLVFFQTFEKGSTDAEIGMPIELEDKAPGADELFDLSCRQEIINHSIGKIPLAYRQVFVMREIEGLSYENICEILDLPLGTLKVKIWRARCCLADILRSHSSFDR